MALFITLGLISRSSAKMLSLAQHADYAQHLSVYAVSCTVYYDTSFNNCVWDLPVITSWDSSKFYPAGISFHGNIICIR
jgi:hypothetical protein